MIRTLYIGDPFMKPGFPTPALVEDPKITVAPILAELAFVTRYEMTRFMRIYLPRTKKQLTENYDLVALAAIRSDHLPANFEKWIAEGVLEGNLSVLMSDDPVSFGCVDAWEGMGAPGWMRTPVGKILPVDDDSRVNCEGILFKFKPVTNSPFTAGIPWEQGPWVFAHNRPTARPGATILMRTSKERPRGGGNVFLPIKNSPVLIYWDIEKGRSVALVYDWGGNGMTDFYRWEYWRDAIARFFYLPVNAKPPVDVELSHLIRQMITQYNVKSGLVVSMIEFTDKLGANTRKVEAELADIGIERKKADEMWIQGDFQECKTTMEKALKDLDTASNDALAAKRSALFWIYLTEWSVVTGTLCAVGGLVWTLMIKRAVYREVETTKFAEDR